MNVLIPVNVARGMLGSFCSSSLPACSSSPLQRPVLLQRLFRFECGDTFSRGDACDLNNNRNAVRDSKMTTTQASISCQKTNQRPLTVYIEWYSKLTMEMTKPLIIMIERQRESPRANFRRKSTWIWRIKYMGMATTEERHSQLRWKNDRVQKIHKWIRTEQIGNDVCTDVCVTTTTDVRSSRIAIAILTRHEGNWNAKDPRQSRYHADDTPVQGYSTEAPGESLEKE